LAARRHSPPVSQFANLADAMGSVARTTFPFLTVWEFPELPGLALEQPQRQIGQISSFVMD
jgi:hypothetical protein